MRLSHITTMPMTKEMATETKMAMITCRALSELSRSAYSSVGSPITLSSASIAVPPSSSKTSETVVEVGMPSVLKASSTMMSVTITASMMVITSWKE